MAAEKGPHGIIVELIPSINRQFYIFLAKGSQVQNPSFLQVLESTFLSPASERTIF